MCTKISYNNILKKIHTNMSLSLAHAANRAPVISVKEIGDTCYAFPSCLVSYY